MSRKIPIAIVRQIIMRIMAGVSDRSIAVDLEVVSRSTVGLYRKKMEPFSYTNEQWLALTDQELNVLLRDKPRVSSAATTVSSALKQSILERLEHIKTEIKLPGVTLQLLWGEFLKEIPAEESCSYQTFCRTLKPHLHKTNLSYHNPKAEPGSVLMIDFAGKKLNYIDPFTGKVIPCTVILGILASSQCGFVEVIPNASTVHVLEALTAALIYYKGAPVSLLTDNMAQLVRKADRYEPTFTDAALEWANHYGIYLRATRIYSPKDKPDIERMVRLVYERIYAALRNQTFHSLEELRKATKEKLQEHNDRKFSGKSYSRSEAFKVDEQPFLRPLPDIHFELQKVTRAKVQRNYHVYLGEDRHFYSVPYQLVGEQMDIRYTAKVVEIYQNLNLVATHLRTVKAYDYTTCEDHMPEAHRAQKKSMGYTGDDFLEKATAIGVFTKLYMECLLKSRTIEQQTYRSCLGLLSLGFSRKYGGERLESACELGCLLGKYTFKTIQNLLEKDKDIAFVASKKSENGNEPNVSSNHDNLRGKEAFE